MKSYRVLLLVGVTLAFCLPKASRSSGSSIYAATIHVLADQTTIQEGINTANNWDTVVRFNNLLRSYR